MHPDARRTEIQASYAVPATHVQNLSTHLEVAVAHLTPAFADQPQPVAAVQHARKHLTLKTLKEVTVQCSAVHIMSAQRVQHSDDIQHSTGLWGQSKVQHRPGISTDSSVRGRQKPKPLFPQLLSICLYSKHPAVLVSLLLLCCCCDCAFNCCCSCCLPTTVCRQWTDNTSPLPPRPDHLHEHGSRQYCPPTARPAAAAVWCRRKHRATRSSRHRRRPAAAVSLARCHPDPRAALSGPLRAPLRKTVKLPLPRAVGARAGL